MSNPELSGINPLEFPIGYFDVQVQFADKWSNISGDDFASTLSTRTALHRRMTGRSGDKSQAEQEWSALLGCINDLADPNAATALLYDA